ncbi:MAG: serine/threonine-protein phosphatase, partial [Bacteroidales bacterium]|nr:serine/threonine-protein phosphatase [Bacteroidales bacterium]
AWIELFEHATGIRHTYRGKKSAILFHLPGREREAIELGKQELAFYDSLHLAEQKASLTEFATIMELDLMQKNLTEQRLEAHRRGTAILIISVSFLFILSVFLYTMVRRLRRTTNEKLASMKAKAEIEQEVFTARNIQDSFLQHDSPADERVVVGATLQPALHVSGDMYDYKLVDDKLFFLIADISGKGLGASLYMSVATCTFRTYCTTTHDPALLMDSINRLICSNNTADIFITAIIGALDLTTGEMTLSNAGHNFPVLLTKKSITEYGAQTVELDTALPLGLVDTMKYTSHQLRLNPGDKLFVYTDGVTEAETADHLAFGEERLTDTLLRTANMAPKEMLAECLHRIAIHSTKTTQNDDITMMAIEYRGGFVNANDNLNDN